MQSIRSLFNKKTIKELVSDIEISDKQISSSKKWLDLLDKDKLYDETPNHPKFMKIILCPFSTRFPLLGLPTAQTFFDFTTGQFDCSVGQIQILNNELI